MKVDALYLPTFELKDLLTERDLHDIESWSPTNAQIDYIQVVNAKLW